MSQDPPSIPEPLEPIDQIKISTGQIRELNAVALDRQLKEKVGCDKPMKCSHYIGTLEGETCPGFEGKCTIKRQWIKQ